LFIWGFGDLGIWGYPKGWRYLKQHKIKENFLNSQNCCANPHKTGPFFRDMLVFVAFLVPEKQNDCSFAPEIFRHFSDKGSTFAQPKNQQQIHNKL